MDDDELNAVAFTDAVKAEQLRRGSRTADGRLSIPGMFRRALRPGLEAFLAEVETAYLATATAAGQPYAQHRGGPKGFIKVVDDDTIGFADFRGNKQYVTAGNLSENPRAFLFLMDYAARRRVKMWGRARMVEDPEVVAALQVPSFAAAPERALLFSVHSFDVNCSQHIPRLVEGRAAALAFERQQARIRDLEAEVATLRRCLGEAVGPRQGAFADGES